MGVTKQPIAAQRSCEAEFIAACKSANELGHKQPAARVSEDNMAAKMLAHNPGALRGRSKHFEIRYFNFNFKLRASAPSALSPQPSAIITQDTGPRAPKAPR